jgi:hypothetical protein
MRKITAIDSCCGASWDERVWPVDNGLHGPILLGTDSPTEYLLKERSPVPGAGL